MIQEVRYCKKHKKPFKSKDGCPVCEAMQNLKGEDYERKIRYHKDNKACEQRSVCGGGCKNTDCSDC